MVVYNRVTVALIVRYVLGAPFMWTVYVNSNWIVIKLNWIELNWIELWKFITFTLDNGVRSCSTQFRSLIQRAYWLINNCVKKLFFVGYSSWCCIDHKFASRWWAMCVSCVERKLETMDCYLLVLYTKD